MWAEVKRILKPRGAFVTTASQPFTSALVMSNVAWFRYCWVWEKTIANNFMNLNRQPRKLHEDVVIFSQNENTYNPQMERGIAYSDRPRARSADSYHQSISVRIKAAIENTGERYPSSIQQFPNPNQDIEHNAQKPVTLYEYLVRTYTNEGDMVLDFCCGSGTTGVAAMNTGRKFIGGDNCQEYVDAAVKRIEAAQAQMRLAL